MDDLTRSTSSASTFSLPRSLSEQVREPSLETLSSLGGSQDEQFTDNKHPANLLSKVQVREIN